MLHTLMNILWFVLGGLIMALCWWLVGLIMAISIVGLPWAKACFVLGKFSLFPFGHQSVSREWVTGQEDIGTGALGLIGNILWFVVAGWWLALGHLSAALACAVTIIGIPFAWQHLKLARIALAPIGKTIVEKH